MTKEDVIVGLLVFMSTILVLIVSKLIDIKILLKQLQQKGEKW